ncbi:hypothetical protein Q1695_014235 [Nippostrongylus brasiliensis]|nr:hypothetical protein Q1695_014235 [Nippostrongylus brasiliensis]
MPEPVFKIRNVLCEYTMGLPSAVNRALYADSKHQVPTFHIFGITSEGKKACVHVHGVLPYLLLRVGADFTPTLGRLMTEKLNRLIQREMALKDGSKEMRSFSDYVCRIEPVVGKSIYGYHEEDEQFAKIFFYNPFYRAKLFDALARELDEFPIMQPFEAHTPFILQFFIDNSIFGMDEIFFKRVQYRVATQSDSQDMIIEGLSVGEVLNSNSLLSPLTPVSSCTVECDAFVGDIMNKELHSANVHSCNPGLEYIWREEAARCAAQGRKLEDTFNNYTPRPYWTNQMEKEMLKRCETLARQMKMDDDPAQCTQTQSLEETLIAGLSGDEDDMFDTTAVWTEDVTELEHTAPPEAPAADDVKEVQEDSDDEGDDTVAQEEFLMTQLMTSMESGEIEKEPTAIEDLIYDEAPPPQPPTEELVKSRWVTMDVDLPLKLKQCSRSAGCSTGGSFPSDVTSVFGDASFHPMPMNESMDHTAIISAGSGADHEMEEDYMAEIVCLSVASLELLVCTQHTMPDPQIDPVLGFSFCLFSDVCRSSVASQLVFVTTLPVQDITNDNIAWVPDERSLFDQLEFFVRRSDPDILFGYDTARLSWGYMLRRAVILGYLNFYQNIARYHRGRQAPLDRHHDLPDDLDPPSGRLLRAVWRILRSELQLRSYDRGTAAVNVLKKKLPILDDRALCREVLGHKPRYAMLANYVNKLALLNISLLNEINWFLKTAEMARVYGIQFYEVWSRGSQLRVESMMFRLAHTQGFFLPSVTPQQRIKMGAPEQLQLILEPQSKVYFDPVIVLDFQSLYPSMIIAYNYCFSTIFGKVAALEGMLHDGDSCIDLGAVKYTVVKQSFVECATKKKLHCSPLSAAFATQSQRCGILPTLLREVIGARIMVKSSMKFAKAKKLRRVLDARQLALKNVANVTYGYTSANFSGRMPCVEVADAILGKGRETLERAIQRVKEGDYGGAKVIYGDTDSMFVLVPGATKKEAFAIGRRIAADVTSANPTPVVLKLEKVYMSCVLETKKRYAGWMYESEDDEEGQLDAKGVETIRRDTCLVVANILERCLKLIFTRNWRALSSYLNTKLTRLRDLPYTDFVFCKEFRGHYTDNAPVPQLKVAMRMAAENPAHIALTGERIPYIVTQGTPNATVISCVRSIPDFLADKRLQIHFTYYAHVHILPALRRVTDLLPLAITWHADSGSYCFTPGCVTLTSNPWCTPCSEFGSTYRFAVASQAREERLRALSYAICCRCQERHQCDMDLCQNHACSVKKVWNGLQRTRTNRAVASHRLHISYGPLDSMALQ